MQKLPFVKYTSCGNNFVILDQIHRTDLTEHQLSDFAFQATNCNFGVGCDNLLVIQRSSDRILKAINRSRGYWRQTPATHNTDFLFRMFEPDGQEALCCGNGLMCIAAYLQQHRRIRQARIMTELPLPWPGSCQIGAEPEGDNWCWANMGTPRQLPETLVDRTGISCSERAPISHLEVDFSPLAERLQLPLPLKFQACLSYTGEPHLVIFPELSHPQLAHQLFHSETPELVNILGGYLNEIYRPLFPQGINVNFAGVQALADVVSAAHPGSYLLNRCYERGIYAETLACGTGALAVAYVFQQLYRSEATQLNVIPLRCRQFDDQACIRVQQRQDGWYLMTRPQQLLEGLFHYHQRQAAPVKMLAASAAEKSLLDRPISDKKQATPARQQATA